jgi:hypothetical protein
MGIKTTTIAVTRRRDKTAFILLPPSLFIHALNCATFTSEKNQHACRQHPRHARTLISFFLAAPSALSLLVPQETPRKVSPARQVGQCLVDPVFLKWLLKFLYVKNSEKFGV